MLESLSCKLGGEPVKLDAIQEGVHITVFSQITPFDADAEYEMIQYSDDSDGLGEEQPANDEVRQILEVVKGQIQGKSGFYGDGKITTFTSLKMTTRAAK